MPGSDLMTPLQHRVLERLFSDAWFRRNFYLTGGTALSAFYLQHRLSDDLDLFTHQRDLGPVEALFRAISIPGELEATQVQKAPSFLRYRIEDELQVDVVADVEFRVGSPELVTSYMVDSLKNIAVNKVTAILGRFDPKDYVDLYLLLTEQDLDIFDLLALGKKKDAGLDLFVWASLLESAERIAFLPRMIRAVELDELKAFYRALRDRVLDSIKPE